VLSIQRAESALNDAFCLDLPSPTQTIEFENHTFFLKRDDLIHPDFSGNKARKFHYFFENDFPDIVKVVSYGSAQSNAMYSLSVLTKMKGWEFEYCVDHVSDYLKDNPHGNYHSAIKNGMQIHVGVTPCGYPKEVLFIEEGGRQEEAEYGIRILAGEILAWQEEQQIEKLNVFLPAGTGTTALYLQKHLLKGQSQGTAPTVYTTHCVGDATYLKNQFFMLEEDENYHPTIFSLEKKYHFGKLYRENYEIWLKLHQETGVVFDLLYDPLGWRTLLAHPEVYEEIPLLYIHQGGILGNESMLPRYERKYKNMQGG